MKVKASILTGEGKSWETATLELAPPQEGEVLVRIEAAGLCHSDEHLRYASARYPITGGHEGAGVVEAVGPGVTRFAVGDHVASSVIPSCGVCEFCSTGRSYLCDSGANIGTGAMLDDTYRSTLDGTDIGGLCLLGTFADRIVTPQSSLVKIPKDIPFDVAALLSCGVLTGWGSAVRAGNVQPGETVVVVGVGGVGVNAVQGALLGGASHIIAVDPLESRRDFALTVGATHAVATAQEAGDLARELSAGTGAQLTIVTAGVVTSEIVSDAFSVTGKGGRIVLTGNSDYPDDVTVQLSGTMMVGFGIRIIAALAGNCNINADMPRLIRLYREGKLKVDELISRRYTVDEVHQAYIDQAEGTILRGVLVHQH